jgi:hypothetical protein
MLRTEWPKGFLGAGEKYMGHLTLPLHSGEEQERTRRKAVRILQTATEMSPSRNPCGAAGAVQTLLTRRALLGKAAMLGAGVALGTVAGNALAAMAPPPPGAVATVPVLSIGDPGSFKILQVTDLHLWQKGSWDAAPKLTALAAMVRRFKPDIIVNTGDCWYSVSGDIRGDRCKWACDEFAQFKTPWAFAWGNHDEAIDYNRAHATLEKSPYSLYCGAADGNYRIAVKPKNGDAPVWNLILLNDSRGGFRSEQIDWFKAEAGRIRKETPTPPPAFLFFHIPLPQYDDVVASGKAVGVKFENVSHENGSRDALPAFRDAGFVKAMFCGHDHVNDYYGLLDGIRLQFGRSLGGYGAEKLRKGATLITVDVPQQAFTVQSVFADGSAASLDKFVPA